MTEKQNNSDEKKRLDWHSGFEGGLMLSLRRYAKDLQIEREHPLSSEPLRIDFLVIKKRPDVLIDNAMGREFKTYNLIEYKNPNDELNIDVLWKVIGYACLYKSFGKSVDAIKSDEITVTILRAAKPAGLLKNLDTAGVNVEKTTPGIYKIDGIIRMPVNIVVIGELQDSELKALSVMRPGVDADTVRQFIDEAQTFTEPGDKRFADAVLEISASVNEKLYERLRGDDGMCEALRRIMAEDLQDAENRGVELGREQGLEQGIEKGIAIFIEDKMEDKVPEDKIIERVETKFKVSREKAAEYVKRLQDSFVAG